MTFVGVGGLAPGADFGSFVADTGTGDFTQLFDEDGSLFEQFGARDRSTFLFVNEDGTFDRTSFGVVGEEELVAEVERLIAS